MDPVKQHIMTIGRAMLALGFQNTHSGNISVRDNDCMYITKTGSMKGHLEERDICKPGLNEPEYGLFQASSETAQHCRVLEYAGSLIHAHAFPVVLMSYIRDKIEPLDAHGRRYLTQAPIVEFTYPVGSVEMEEKIPEILKTVPAMVVKTHGPFVRGRDLDEAFFHLCLLDYSASILYDLIRMGKGLEKLHIPSYPGMPDHESAKGVFETKDTELLKQFRRTANDLFYLKLSPFHTGALSVADGKEMLYSPALAVPEGMPIDIRRVEVAGKPNSFIASLHHAVYLHSNAKAALFSLSPEAVALSLVALAEGKDRIIPADAEGGYFYPAVPVVSPSTDPREIVDKAVRYKMVVIAGIGTLAVGHTPGHTIHHNSSLKNLCHFLIQLSILQRLGEIDSLEPLLCSKGKNW